MTLDFWLSCIHHEVYSVSGHRIHGFIHAQQTPYQLTHIVQLAIIFSCYGHSWPPISEESTKQLIFIKRPSSLNPMHLNTNINEFFFKIFLYLLSLFSFWLFFSLIFAFSFDTCYLKWLQRLGVSLWSARTSSKPSPNFSPA